MRNILAVKKLEEQIDQLKMKMCRNLGIAREECSKEIEKLEMQKWELMHRK